MLFLLGPPILVPLTYYVLGWQLAVLILPVLVFVAAKRSGTRSHWRSRKHYWAVRIMRLVLVALPVTAVALGREEFMRLWPLFIGLGFLFASEGLLANMTSQHRYLLRRYFKLFHFAIATAFLATFIGLSELIWHFFGMQGWVWFHSLFMFNMIGVGMIVGWGIVTLFGGMPDETMSQEIKGRLPRKDAEDETETFHISIQHGDGRTTRYENARLSHFHKLFDRMDWAQEIEAYEARSGRWTDHPRVTFAVEMGRGYYFNIFSDQQNTHGVRVGYIRGRSRKVHYQNLLAVNAPFDQLPSWMELAWKSDWAALREEMTPYFRKF